MKKDKQNRIGTEKDKLWSYKKGGWEVGRKRKNGIGQELRKISHESMRKMGGKWEEKGKAKKNGKWDREVIYENDGKECGKKKDKKIGWEVRKSIVWINKKDGIEKIILKRHGKKIEKKAILVVQGLSFLLLTTKLYYSTTQNFLFTSIHFGTFG